jgi:hypothetical protein
MKSLSDKLDDLNFIIGEWQKCEFCRIVDKDRNRSRFGYECPVCSKPSKGGVMYFEISVHLTIDLIVEAFTTEHKVEHEGTEYEYITNTHFISVLLFFCTLREILLNGLIRELCWGLKLPEGVYNRLIKDNKFYIQKQNDLFPSLTGEKWLDALTKLSNSSEYNYVELNKRIKELSDLRNEFVHKGKGFHIDEQVANNCVDSIEPLIILYVELHNLFVHPMYLK